MTIKFPAAHLFRRLLLELLRAFLTAGVGNENMTNGREIHSVSLSFPGSRLVHNFSWPASGNVGMRESIRGSEQD